MCTRDGGMHVRMIVTLSEAKGTIPADGPLRFAQGDKGDA
jgi:hypothetical protein